MRTPLPTVHQQIDMVGPDGRVRPDVNHWQVDQLREDGFKVIRGWKEMYMPQYDQALNPGGEFNENLAENIDEEDLLEVDVL